MKFSYPYIIALCCIFTSLTAQAQFGAEFYVVSDIGCGPFTVSVIDSSGAPPQNVNVYNYGEGSSVTQDTFYTYTSPGTYEITQTVPLGDPRDTSLTIRVVEPTTPTYNLSNCKGTDAFFHGDDTLYEAFYVSWGDGNSEVILNGQIQQHSYGSLGTYNVTVQGMMDPNQSPSELANISCSSSFTSLNLVADIVPGTIDVIDVLNQDSILLNFTIDPNTSYYLEMSQNGSSNFSIQDTFSVNSLPVQYIISNINTDANFYCFRLTAFDPCDGATTPSPVACSVNLQGTAVNNQNLLDWSTETTDLDQFEIYRDGNFLATTVNVNYADGSVTCGTEYCYRVILNENGGLQSFSNQFCITAISIDKPPSISDIVATIVGDQPILSWELPSTPYSSFYITRHEEGGANEVNFVSSNNNFTDSSAQASSRRYYYDVFYEDLCGNFSLPTTTSPVFLNLLLEPTIVWTNYLGWTNNVNHYVIEFYDEDLQSLGEMNVGLDTVYTEVDLNNLPQVVIYRVQAIPNDLTLPTVQSNFLKVTFPSNVVFPNSFTPNGDGLNDIFTYKGLYVSSFSMSIFNKWGELIFRTENPDTGWDGTKNSIPEPSGMYIFNAEFTDEAGISFVKKGEVYLLR